MAQQQLRQPRPSVEVDWTVLDELGAQGSAPVLRAPGRAGAPQVAPPARAAAAPQQPAALVPPASVARQTGTPTGTRVGPQNQTAQAPAFTPPPPPPSFVPPAPLAQPAPVAPSAVTSAPVAAPPPPPPPPPAATQTAPTRVAPAPPPPPPAVVQAPPPPPPPPAAAIAPPPPPPVATPAPAPAQVAAAPAARAASSALATLAFAAGASDLTDQNRAALGPVLEALRGDSGARLQIQAYASGGDDQGSQARRLSLSRALAVRGHLIEQGIAATRMDVRALGRTGDGPSDRVDILLVRR